MRTRLLLIVLTVALSTLVGCRKPATTSQPAANNNNAAPIEAPVGGKALAGDKVYFHGRIAGTLAIEMTLTRDGDRLTGSYLYPKVGKNINLAGTVDKDGNVQLKETDESGKDTGVFKGKWKPATDSPDPGLNEIEGKWSKPDGSKETEFSLMQQPIEFSAPVLVTSKVIHEANKQKHYTVDAKYPQIDGDPRFDNFNKEARAMITKDVAAFKAGETGAEADTGTTLADEARESTLDVGYEIRCATDQMISVEFIEVTYEAGAAHDNILTTVLNYDVKNGKKLALADLFNTKSNYLSVISAYCVKDLRDRAKKDKDSMLMEDMLKDGASPRADNYRACAITKKGLWITFDPYQVAAFAAGPQHVLVPYSALKDIMKPDGPLTAFAQ